MTNTNSIEPAKGLRQKVQQAAAKGAKDAREGGKKVAAKVGKGAEAGAKRARDAKAFVDIKARASLDKAYEARRPAAVKNLARLRKANTAASPVEVLELLAGELSATEAKSGADTKDLMAAAGLYVLTALEVHGDEVADVTARQRLLDAILVFDSKAARSAIKIGGFALAFFSKRLAALGIVAKLVGKHASKVAWLTTALAAMAGLQNAGKKSAAWVVTSATRKILGNPPETWVSTSSTEPKSRATKKKPTDV